MATAPKSTWSSRSKPARKWVVRMGDTAGSSPSATDETKLLRWPVVSLAHGSKNTHCTFDYNLGKDAKRIQDTYLETGFARQVEVVQVSEDPTVADILVFWGELASQTLAVNERGEFVNLKATIENYHFGSVLTGPVYRQPASPFDPFPKHDEIVFNPRINNVIESNQSTHKANSGLRNEYNYWLHPDSARTAAARQYAQASDTALTWTLAEAVATVIWLCNPSETYVTNPARTDIDAWLIDAPAVKNLELPTGRYLPDYLDAMLNPFGYGWAMTFNLTAGIRIVSYRFFKLNDDQPSKLLMQKPGDSRGIRFTLSNVIDFQVETTTVSQANKITAMGDFKEFEITMELFRGWNESQDALTAAGLTQSTGADYYYAANWRAWRLWVANEGGDYCGKRTTAPTGSDHDNRIPTTPPDLSSFLGAEYIPRNREPLDCLTHWTDDAGGEKKRRRPPFIEWYNASNQWAALPDGWGETVLTDQCAVMFAGDAPPTELIARGANARIRMTFTMRSDERLVATAARDSSSVNLRTNEMVVDVHDRFKYRVINAVSPYASVFVGFASDARDDQTALTAFTEKLRAVEDVAIMRGTATLNTINLGLKVGQTISEIDGRDVSFNRMAKTSSTKKYLQIISITHDHQKQQTSLRVAPLTEEVQP